MLLYVKIELFAFCPIKDLLMDYFVFYSLGIRLKSFLLYNIQLVFFGKGIK